jgi:integrase
MSTGIETRHAYGCPAKHGGRCKCDPHYQAHVWDAASAKRIRKTFKTKTGARQWRTDAQSALRQGALAESKPKTPLADVCEQWLADARAGIVRTRGQVYKPGTLMAYEQSLRLRVYPELGSAPFYRVRLVHLQDLVDRMLARDVAPATIRACAGALGAIYARAVQRGELPASPVRGLRLPTVQNGRMRFETPQGVCRLLAAAPDRDRAVWATAFYAGLRRGELQALSWDDVDLKAGTLSVHCSWSMAHGLGATKNRDSRKVPVLAPLREHLAAERLRKAPGIEFCFGLEPGRPFRPDRLQQRADEAWQAVGLERLTLHDCRHTFASLAIAAGANAKALSSYMGHSSVAITFDRYGHLMPGNEAEFARLLDAYLAEQTG